MSAQFTKAVEDVKKLKSDPTNDEKLSLYALYKIGNGEEAKKAGMFDLAGKAKFSAFEKEKAAGTSKEEAQKKYVELVATLVEKYGSN